MTATRRRLSFFSYKKEPEITGFFENYMEISQNISEEVLQMPYRDELRLLPFRELCRE